MATSVLRIVGSNQIAPAPIFGGGTARPQSLLLRAYMTAIWEMPSSEPRNPGEEFLAQLGRSSEPSNRAGGTREDIQRERKAAAGTVTFYAWL
jgi:hypothetical protein